MLDWRDVKQYSYVKSLSLAGVAWEFLRRNPDYQKEFADFHRRIEDAETKYGPLSKLTKTQLEKIHELWHFCPHKENHQSIKQWMSECLSKNIRPIQRHLRIALAKPWWLKQMRSPRLKAEKGKNYLLRPQPLSSVFWKLEDLSSAFDLPDERRGAAAYAVFDLRCDLERQIAEVRNCLYAARTAHRVKAEPIGMKKRARQLDWIQRLRALDAHRSGATNHEIAKQIFPNTNQTDYHANKLAYDAIEQAEYRTKPEGYLALVRTYFSELTVHP